MSQFYIIERLWKLILLGPDAFLINYDINAKEIFFFIISVKAILTLIYDFGPILCNGFRNVNLYTKAFFSLIDLAIFFLKSQSIDIVLNWNSFVYLRIV